VITSNPATGAEALQVVLTGLDLGVRARDELPAEAGYVVVAVDALGVPGGDAGDAGELLLRPGDHGGRGGCR
jgi:hypothetical protein